MLKGYLSLAKIDLLRIRVPQIARVNNSSSSGACKHKLFKHPAYETTNSKEGQRKTTTGRSTKSSFYLLNMLIKKQNKQKKEKKANHSEVGRKTHSLGNQKEKALLSEMGKGKLLDDRLREISSKKTNNFRFIIITSIIFF